MKSRKRAKPGKSRKHAKPRKKSRIRVAPQRLVEGEDFRINKRIGRRVDISPTGMARIVEEWLKGRPSILVADGREVAKIRGKES
jgi:hypothetical protein